MEVGFVGCEVAEAFAGSVIEAFLDRQAEANRDVCEGAPFGEVLADEAVGVFVGAAFPGVMWSSEVEGGAELFFDVFIAVELSAVVRGDGVDFVRFE